MEARIFGVEGIDKMLKEFSKDKILLTTEIALNTTAKETKDHLTSEMKSAFSAPKPYIPGGLFVNPAKRSIGKLQSSVKVKDVESKGLTHVKYFLPSVQGGKRNVKGFEGIFSEAGYVPNGYKLIPGPDIKIDTHGNVSRANFERVYQGLSSTTGTYKGWTYLISTDGKTIFRVKRLKVEILFFVEPDPTYSVIYNFLDIGNYGQRALTENVNKAVAETIRRAKVAK